MNISQRFKDKIIVGTITNYACIMLLTKFLFTGLSGKQINIGIIIFSIVILINLVFLLISSRTLKRQKRQSKISIFGKSFTFIIALAVIVIVIINTNFLYSIENIFDIWLSAIIVFYVPRSIYLFRNQPEAIELPPQSEKRITADQLKMPPHAWDD